jgi:hypothetical protein
MGYDVHPLAELIPPMSDEEYGELRADVEANGLRAPVTLYEGMVLDGRHRARVCDELGREFETVQFEGEDPAGFVISMNLRRRNLTVGQRATAAIALLDYEKERAKERQAKGLRRGDAPAAAESRGRQKAHTGDRARRRAVNEAGERLGVSGKSVERAQRVAAEDPELHEKVKRGEVSLNAAHHEISGERTKRERAEGQPLAPPKTERQKQRAAAYRERFDGAITQIGTLASAVLEMDLPRARVVADGDTLAYWQKTVRDAARNLHSLSRRLEGTG